MPTLTVRSLDDETYTRLKELARRNHRSMEAEARHILMDVVYTRERWPEGTVLADLAGSPEVAAIEVSFERSRDLPREVDLG